MKDQSRIHRKVITTFTHDAKQVLAIAEKKSLEDGLDYVCTEHILMGILAKHDSAGANILMNFGVSLDNVLLVIKTVGRKAKTYHGKMDGGLSGPAKQVVERAMYYARSFNHNSVGTTHLLLALCSQKNTAFAIILENMKINSRDIKEQAIQVAKSNP